MNLSAATSKFWARLKFAQLGLSNSKCVIPPQRDGFANLGVFAAVRNAGIRCDLICERFDHTRRKWGSDQIPGVFGADAETDTLRSNAAIATDVQR